MIDIKKYEEFNFKDLKDYFLNIPEKCTDIYKSIKNIFSGNVKIEFIPNYKKYPISTPVDIIHVSKKRIPNDENNIKNKIILQLPGKKPRYFDYTAHFVFNLTKDLDIIKDWLSGYDEEKYKPIVRITKDDPYGEENWNPNIKPPEVSQIDDFIMNFDEYQGDLSLPSTKDKPYEFWDED